MLRQPLQSGTVHLPTPSTSAEGALTEALHLAVRHGHESEVKTLVRRIVGERQPLSAAAVAGLVAQACAFRCPLGVKTALTDLPGFHGDASTADGRTLLSIAAESADPEFVRHLLQLGADPRKVRTFAPVRQDIGELLTAAITINALISKRARDGRSTTPVTRLEQALRDYDLRQAKALLDQERTRQPDHSNAALWTRAASEKRSDIHCAMLVLSDSASIEELTSPNRPGWRNVLEQATRIGQPRLRSWLKQVPYYPHRFGLPKDLNCKTTFPGSDIRIECRHLALFWLHQRAQAGKNDYSTLQTAERIVQHVGIELDKTASMLTKISPEIHLIDNRQWGRFLVTQFNAMQASAKPGETLIQRQICLNSLTHTLGAHLTLKLRPDGTRQYAVSMYDPNLTNVHKRAATSDLAVVSQWRFVSFLASAEHEDVYYPEQDKLSSAFVVSGDHLDAPPAPGTPRRLASGIPPLTPTVLNYLLTEDLTGEISARQEEICAIVEALDNQDAIEWLAARDGLGMPALHAALNYGNAAAIAAYADLLYAFDIPKHTLAILFAAKDSRGVPGLHMALQQGHTTAVSMFGKVASMFDLPAEQLTDLLHCRNADGVPGLYKGIRQGHVETAKAFGRMLNDSALPPSAQMELLAAADRDGLTALHLFLEDKQIDAIHAFGELVGESALPAEQKRELLLARNPWGQLALMQLSPEDRQEVTAAFNEMARRAGLSGQERRQLDLALDDFRYAGGQGPTPEAGAIDASILRDLPTLGDADELRMRQGEIAAFLKTLAPEEAVEWLEARDSAGTPALHTALARGHADVVTAFGDILTQLHGLTPRQVANLLMAEGGSGRTGLHAALANCHADAVVAFGAVMRELDFPRPYKMVLLLAENTDGMPGIIAASDAGDDATVRAFYHLLDNSDLPQPDIQELERIIDGYHPGP